VDGEVQIDRRNLAGSYSEGDADHRHEVLLTFCDQAEKVIELLNASCETDDLTVLIRPTSRLRASCQQLGLDSMVLTLGQIGRAAQDRNPRAIRWLLTSLGQEYMTISLTMQGNRLRHHRAPLMM
jgi:hypothetical protein